MKKATYIKPEDLYKLEYNVDGNIIIPEGFEIYIKEDPEEKRQEIITELENQLSNMREPTDEELIEEGKIMHPYYMIMEELKYLKE